MGVGSFFMIQSSVSEILMCRGICRSGRDTMLSRITCWTCLLRSHRRSRQRRKRKRKKIRIKIRTKKRKKHKVVASASPHIITAGVHVSSSFLVDTCVASDSSKLRQVSSAVVEHG